MINRNNLSWKDNKLMFQGKELVSYVPHETYKSMYWVQWPEGDRSETFYNLTRTKEHCYRIAMKNAGLDEE